LRVAKPVFKVGQLVELIALPMAHISQKKSFFIFHFSLVFKVGQLVELIALVLPMAHISQNHFIFHFSFPGKSFSEKNFCLEFIFH
jgi:hypothetical protein